MFNGRSRPPRMKLAADHARSLKTVEQEAAMRQLKREEQEKKRNAALRIVRCWRGWRSRRVLMLQAAVHLHLLLLLLEAQDARRQQTVMETTETGTPGHPPDAHHCSNGNGEERDEKEFAKRDERSTPNDTNEKEEEENKMNETNGRWEELIELFTTPLSRLLLEEMEMEIKPNGPKRYREEEEEELERWNRTHGSEPPLRALLWRRRTALPSSHRTIPFQEGLRRFFWCCSLLYAYAYIRLPYILFSTPFHGADTRQDTCSSSADRNAGEEDGANTRMHSSLAEDFSSFSTAPSWTPVLSSNLSPSLLISRFATWRRNAPFTPLSLRIPPVPVMFSSKDGTYVSSILSECVSSLLPMVLEAFGTVPNDAWGRAFRLYPVLSPFTTPMTTDVPCTVCHPPPSSITAGCGHRGGLRFPEAWKEDIEATGVDVCQIAHRLHHVLGASLLAPVCCGVVGAGLLAYLYQCRRTEIRQPAMKWWITTTSTRTTTTTKTTKHRTTTTGPPSVERVEENVDYLANFNLEDDPEGKAKKMERVQYVWKLLLSMAASQMQYTCSDGTTPSDTPTGEATSKAGEQPPPPHAGQETRTLYWEETVEEMYVVILNSFQRWSFALSTLSHHKSGVVQQLGATLPSFFPHHRSKKATEGDTPRMGRLTIHQTTSHSSSSSGGGGVDTLPTEEEKEKDLFREKKDETHALSSSRWRSTPITRRVFWKWVKAQVKECTTLLYHTILPTCFPVLHAWTPVFLDAHDRLLRYTQKGTRGRPSRWHAVCSESFFAPIMTPAPSLTKRSTDGVPTATSADRTEPSHQSKVDPTNRTFPSPLLTTDPLYLLTRTFGSVASIPSCLSWVDRVRLVQCMLEKECETDAEGMVVGEERGKWGAGHGWSISPHPWASTYRFVCNADSSAPVSSLLHGPLLHRVRWWSVATWTRLLPLFLMLFGVEEGPEEATACHTGASLSSTRASSLEVVKTSTMKETSGVGERSTPPPLHDLPPPGRANRREMHPLFPVVFQQWMERVGHLLQVALPDAVFLSRLVAVLKTHEKNTLVPAKVPVLRTLLDKDMQHAKKKVKEEALKQQEQQEEERRKTRRRGKEEEATVTKEDEEEDHLHKNSGHAMDGKARTALEPGSSFLFMGNRTISTTTTTMTSTTMPPPPAPPTRRSIKKTILRWRRQEAHITRQAFQCMACWYHPNAGMRLLEQIGRVLLEEEEEETSPSSSSSSATAAVSPSYLGPTAAPVAAHHASRMLESLCRVFAWPLWYFRRHPTPEQVLASSMILTSMVRSRSILPHLWRLYRNQCTGVAAIYNDPTTMTRLGFPLSVKPSRVFLCTSSSSSASAAVDASRSELQGGAQDQGGRGSAIVESEPKTGAIHLPTRREASKTDATVEATDGCILMPRSWKHDECPRSLLRVVQERCRREGKTIQAAPSSFITATTAGGGGVGTDGKQLNSGMNIAKRFTWMFWDPYPEVSVLLFSLLLHYLDVASTEDIRQHVLLHPEVYPVLVLYLRDVVLRSHAFGVVPYCNSAAVARLALELLVKIRTIDEVVPLIPEKVVWHCVPSSVEGGISEEEEGGRRGDTTSERGRTVMNLWSRMQLAHLDESEEEGGALHEEGEREGVRWVQHSLRKVLGSMPSQEILNEMRRITEVLRDTLEEQEKDVEDVTRRPVWHSLDAFSSSRSSTSSDGTEMSEEVEEESEAFLFEDDSLSFSPNLSPSNLTFHRSEGHAMSVEQEPEDVGGASSRPMASPVLAWKPDPHRGLPPSAAAATPERRGLSDLLYPTRNLPPPPQRSHEDNREEVRRNEGKNWNVDLSAEDSQFSHTEEWSEAERFLRVFLQTPFLFPFRIRAAFFVRVLSTLNCETLPTEVVDMQELESFRISVPGWEVEEMGTVELVDMDQRTREALRSPTAYFLRIRGDTPPLSLPFLRQRMHSDLREQLFRLTREEPFHDAFERFHRTPTSNGFHLIRFVDSAVQANAVGSKPTDHGGRRRGGERVESGVGEGVYREAIICICRDGFSPKHGLFCPTPGGDLLYPNPYGMEETRDPKHLEKMRFLGCMLGRAMHDGITQELPFAPHFMNLLLERPNTFMHLKAYDPQLCTHLLELPTLSDEVLDHLGLTFTAVEKVAGEMREVELVNGGKTLKVSRKNIFLYLHLMTDFYLNRRGIALIKAFQRGLTQFIPQTILQLFDGEEVMKLIVGNQREKFNVEDWKKHTNYNNATGANLKTVDLFWKVVESMTREEQSKLLRFATSFPAPPLLGFKSLSPRFCLSIENGMGLDKLPTASTCFSILRLPRYATFETMKTKLLLAIESNTFELN